MFKKRPKQVDGSPKRTIGANADQNMYTKTWPKLAKWSPKLAICTQIVITFPRENTWHYVKTNELRARNCHFWAGVPKVATPRTLLVGWIRFQKKRKLFAKHLYNKRPKQVEGSPKRTIGTNEAQRMVTKRWPKLAEGSPKLAICTQVTITFCTWKHETPITF